MEISRRMAYRHCPATRSSELGQDVERRCPYCEIIILCHRVGQAEAKSHQDIQLSGENILEEHCLLEHTPGK